MRFRLRRRRLDGLNEKRMDGLCNDLNGMHVDRKKSCARPLAVDCLYQ